MMPEISATPHQSDFANESDFHKAFEKWLDRAGILYVTSAMHKATTQKCGEPDYFLIMNGKVLAVELKTAKGRLSAAQVKRHAEYGRTGTCVHICRDLDTAIRLVLAWRGLSADEKPSRSEVPTHNLRVRGNGVFEYRDGALHHVRVATNDDKLRLTAL